MEFELIPQRVSHLVGQPRFSTIINSNYSIHTCGSRIMLVPLECEVTAVVVSKMCSEGHFSTDTHAVVISGDNNLDRSCIIDIDRELIAQGRTTTVVGNLNGEEVRVVRSSKRGLQSIACGSRNVAVSKSPLVRDRIISSIVHISNQNAVIVTNITDDRVARNLDSRITVNNNCSITSIHTAAGIFREISHTIDVTG